MVQEVFVLKLFPKTTQVFNQEKHSLIINYENLKNTNVWMTLIFIPMAFNIYLIFALIFIHPYDSIDFNIKKGDY